MKLKYNDCNIVIESQTSYILHGHDSRKRSLQWWFCLIKMVPLDRAKCLWANLCYAWLTVIWQAVGLSHHYWLEWPWQSACQWEWLTFISSHRGIRKSKLICRHLLYAYMLIILVYQTKINDAVRIWECDEPPTFLAIPFQMIFYSYE